MAGGVIPLPVFSLGQIQQAGGVLLGGPQRAASYTGNRAVPNESLGFDAYAMLFRLGFMTSESFSSELLDLGHKRDVRLRGDYRVMNLDTDGKLKLNRSMLYGTTYSVDRAVALAKNLPSPDEILVLLNRGMITKELAVFLIEVATGGEKLYATKYLELADQIPGPSDLIAFAVRDVFTPDIVKTFEYNKELPTAILPWMAKQGLGGKTGQPMPPGSTTTEGEETRTETQWFDYYWWSHWQLPSVGQGYEMLQRLYPSSRFGPSPAGTPATYFSTANLELLQKANDYPPFWRERLQAISYHPLGRIDIKRMYSSGILLEDDTHHDVYHAYRSAGYSDTDAWRLTRYAVKTQPSNIQDVTVKQIDKLYKLGVIKYSEAWDKLIAINYRPNAVALHLNQLDLEVLTDDIEHNLKSGKHAFLSGDFSVDNAKAFLNTLGLTPVAQERHLRQWQLELATSRRHISANEALRMYKNGTLALVALQTRLTNLNYPPSEIAQIVLDANNEILVKQVKAELAAIKQAAKPIKPAKVQADKTALANQKARAKVASDKVKAETKAGEDDKKAFSEANIKAFIKSGFLTKAQVENILSAKGWLPDTIALWIAEFGSKLK